MPVTEEKSKVEKLNTEDMKKALNEYIDSMFEKDSAKEDKESDLAKSADCDDEDMEKKKTSSKKTVEKSDEKKKKDDEDEDEDEDEDSSENFYKKGFMDAVKRMKEKSTKKSLSAVHNEITEETSVLQKSIEALTAKVNSVVENVTKLSSQPASSRRSVRSIDIMKKSRNEAEDIDIDGDSSKTQVSDLIKSKAARYQIADIMFEDGLMKSKPESGLQITSRHIAEYEATGRISDTRIMKAVEAMIRNRQNQGLI